MNDKARAEWHQWFAWHPIRLKDGRRVWLETVECREIFGKMIVSLDYMMDDVECEGWYWEYRPLATVLA